MVQILSQLLFYTALKNIWKTAKLQCWDFRSVNQKQKTYNTNIKQYENKLNNIENCHN